MDASAIGYPSSTVEGRAADGLVVAQLPAHSISPEVMMPPRVAAQADELSPSALAKKFEISRNQVYRIVNYSDWKHVTG